MADAEKQFVISTVIDARTGPGADKAIADLNRIEAASKRAFTRTTGLASDPAAFFAQEEARAAFRTPGARGAPPILKGSGGAAAVIQAAQAPQGRGFFGQNRLFGSQLGRAVGLGRIGGAIGSDTIGGGLTGAGLGVLGAVAALGLGFRALISAVNDTVKEFVDLRRESLATGRSMSQLRADRKAEEAAGVGGGTFAGARGRLSAAATAARGGDVGKSSYFAQVGVNFNQSDDQLFNAIREKVRSGEINPSIARELLGPEGFAALNLAGNAGDNKGPTAGQAISDKLSSKFSAIGGFKGLLKAITELGGLGGGPLTTLQGAGGLLDQSIPGQIIAGDANTKEMEDRLREMRGAREKQRIDDSVKAQQQEARLKATRGEAGGRIQAEGLGRLGLFTGLPPGALSQQQTVTELRQVNARLARIESKIPATFDPMLG